MHMISKYRNIILLVIAVIGWTVVSMLLLTSPEQRTIPVTVNTVVTTAPATVTVDIQSVETKKIPVSTVVYEATVSGELFLDNMDEYPVSKRELLALTTVLYCEARGESWYGISAVADTIRNRVNSKLFPSTYYEVVTQRRQFSCINNPLQLYKDAVVRNNTENKIYLSIMKIAYRTISGKLGKMTSNALFYHTTAINPYWAASYGKLGVVGNHVFYTATKL